MKRLFLSALMALTMIPWVYGAASSGNCGPTTNGVFSNTCTWKIDTVMHYQYGRCPRLTISGSGSTADFSLSNPWPWSEHMGSIKMVEIKSGVTRLGELIFWNHTELREISIASSVTTIGDAAFVGCSSIKQINLPARVQIIGWAAFEGCKALTAINAVNSTYFYSDNGVLYTYDKKELVCFPIAAAITDYTILPEAVTLRGRAISDVTNLTTLRLHKDITDYQDDCLSGSSSSITDIYAPFAPLQELPSKAISFSKASEVNLHVPYNFRYEYENTAGWKNFNIVGDLPVDYTDCICIDGQWCRLDENGLVTSSKIISGTVTYKNKRLTLDNATIEGSVIADVQFISVAGECTITGNDANALHLVSGGSFIAIFSMSEDAHLILKVEEPTAASLKTVALYSEAPSIIVYNDLMQTNSSLGITIETRRIGIDAPGKCKILLDKTLRFMRIRPEASSAFNAYCYTDKITFSLFEVYGSENTSAALLEETDDEDGNCLWESTQGIEEVIANTPDNKAHKVLVDGVIYIARDGKLFNLQGARVK